MTKVIKVLTKDIENCTDCPWMSPTHRNPADMDSEIILICSHPTTCHTRSFAAKDRDIGPTAIPEWCPLEDKHV